VGHGKSGWKEHLTGKRKRVWLNRLFEDELFSQVPFTKEYLQQERDSSKIFRKVVPEKNLCSFFVKKRWPVGKKGAWTVFLFQVGKQSQEEKC